MRNYKKYEVINMKKHIFKISAAIVSALDDAKIFRKYLTKFRK